MNINDSNIRPELTFRRLVYLHMQQLTNFPYIEQDFDALTDYELLCLVVKYLNDVINNSNEQNTSITNLYNAFLQLQTYMNNSVQELEDAWTDKTTELENTWTEKTTELETAFNNLQTWINNYFDNLDVQDEIDNKLDEMLEDGVLEQIIEQFIQSTALWCFDNVAAMKTATNFISGSYAKTLGYYNKNDGGGALYKIRELASGETPDEGFVIAITNTNLVAELIVEDAININSLGADNTGTNDSSSKFNLAFTKINDNFYNGNTRVNTVLVNGKYLINNQVTIVPFAKIKGTGFTTFLTNVTGSAFKIDYLSTTVPTFDGNKQDWLQGELINLSQGGLFKNVGTDLTNTCIEIGRDSDIDALLPYSRYKLCNFRIYNYNIGILHNRFHNYIGKFDNISFETNNIGVQYGIETASVNDSGENMTYNNCLFSHNTDCLKWYTDGFDSSFINCSFDFSTNLFNDAGNKGYKKISVLNSHIEGFTLLVSKMGQQSVVSFDHCTFMYSQHGQMFTDIGNYVEINMSMNKLMPISTTEKDPTKILDISQPRKMLFNNFVGHGSLYTGFIRNNKITNFDGITDGSVTLTNNDFYGGLKLIDHTSGYTASIVTDNYLYTGHKSLVLTVDTESTAKKSILFQTDFIPLGERQYIESNQFYYNCTGTDQIKYSFYDNKQNLISETDYSHYIPDNLNKTQNEWFMSPNAKKVVIPGNACYVKIQFNVINMNNDRADTVGTVYKIGGFIVN